MIQKLIPYVIGFQIFVGLFHAGIGVEEWRHSGIYDNQTLFLLSLSLGTLMVYLRLKNMPIQTRSLSVIFEHSIFLGMIAWFFYHPWWTDWEVFFVFFLSINVGILLLLMIFESQFQRNFWAWNWWIPDFFWKLGSFLTLINTITIPLIFVILHENLSIVWIFFGINWIFLWKEDFSQK